MRGSAAFRAAVAPGGVLAGPWVRNELWRRARAVPSLDQRFAESKSLVDAVSGQNLITFTRASAGTFTNSARLIETAVTNLFLQSEDFSTTWTQQGTPTVSTNTWTAPNGTTTGDTITVGSNSITISQVPTVLSSTSYVVSFYLNTSLTTVAFIRIRFAKQAGTDGDVWLNPSTLAFSDYAGGTSGGQAVLVAPNVYRVSVVIAYGASEGGENRISIGGTTSSNSSDPDSGEDIALWGAQLEQSSTVTEYIPTTSVINSAPRFDHDPVTGESLGLLVEESRSNLLLNSATLATQNVTVTAVAHTLSFYGTGTVTLSGTHSATVVGTGAYPSRATLTFTPTAGTLTVTVSGTVEYANLEPGSFATSYIPTTTATVTRSADVASISGSNFSAWYRQDKETVYFQGQTTASATNNIYAGFSTDGTFSNSLYFVKNTSNELQATGMNTSLTLGNVSSNIMLKSAVGYISGTGSASGSLNGGTVDVDSSTSILSTMTSFVIGSAPWSPGNSSWNGTIRRLTCWPQRLPNTTLQSITQ